MTKQTQQDLVYEDSVVSVTHGAGAVGHLVVRPKNKVKKFQELDDASATRFLLSASYAASILFETLQSEGTNIIVSSDPELRAEVVPRSFKDSIKLEWTPLEVDAEEFKEIANRIKDAADSEPQGQKSKEATPLKKESALSQEDYRVKHLRRLP